MKGSQSISKFVSDSINRPSLDTVEALIRERRVALKLAFSKYNFIAARQTIELAKKMHKITGPVPTLMAEDETAIQANPHYLEESDTIIGFCGPMTEDPKNHRCQVGLEIKVGEDPGACDRTVNMFETLKAGNYLRVIMINSLHRLVPKFIIFFTITCDMFNHGDVFLQWQELENLYRIHLQDLLGPLLGHSSDGDTQRRKLTFELFKQGNFQPIPLRYGFIYSSLATEFPDGVDYVGLCDQDAIHNHKKLINPMEHPTRVLRMGPYMIHSTHLQLVHATFPPALHGLRENDITHRDRQNWESAQRIFSYPVQECLDILITGNDEIRPNPNVLATRVYLEVTAKYVDIFFSPAISDFDRVRYASCVANFLAIWRSFIMATRGLTLKDNRKNDLILIMTPEKHEDLLMLSFLAILLFY